MNIHEFRADLIKKHWQEYCAGIAAANDKLNAEHAATGTHFKEVMWLLHRRYYDRKSEIVRELPPDEQENAARQALAEFDAASDLARQQLHEEMTAASKYHSMVCRLIRDLCVERTSATASGVNDYKFPDEVA